MARSLKSPSSNNAVKHCRRLALYRSIDNRQQTRQYITTGTSSDKMMRASMSAGHLNAISYHAVALTTAVNKDTQTAQESAPELPMVAPANRDALHRPLTMCSWSSAANVLHAVVNSTCNSHSPLVATWVQWTYKPTHTILIQNKVFENAST